MKFPENIKEIKKFAEEIDIDVKYLLGEKWEGNLNLSSVKSLPINIKFDVGGWLDLSSVVSLPDNIQFNVSGYLDLESVRSLPNNIQFNVGGKIFIPTNHKVKVIWN